MLSVKSKCFQGALYITYHILKVFQVLRVLYCSGLPEIVDQHLKKETLKCLIVEMQYDWMSELGAFTRTRDIEMTSGISVHEKFHAMPSSRKYATLHIQPCGCGSNPSVEITF